MKKIISVFIIICSLLCLYGCNAGYEPVPSTDEESRTVLSFSLGGEDYNIKYELYRALFLNNKKAVDGGDESVWTGADKEDYINEIDEIIVSEAARIYSAFALCKEIGINIYSDKVEKQIREYVKMSVVGGAHGGVSVQGHGGDYDKYLAALKEMNLNYSVQALMFRYAIAIEEIENYYVSTKTEDISSNQVNVGALKYTEEDVEEFYFSDECVRVLRMHLSLKYDNNPEDRLERVKDALDSALPGGLNAVKSAMINNGSLSTEPEMKNGFVIGRHNLNEGIYKKLTDAAFALEYDSISEPVRIHDGNDEFYFFLYRLDKSEEHLEECYLDIERIYVEDRIGAILDEKKEALIESTVVSDLLATLDRSLISMN